MVKRNKIEEMAELASKIGEAFITPIAEKVLQEGLKRSFKVVSRKFLRKRALSITLLYGLLFYFYTYPKYDECMLELEKALKDLREKKDQIAWRKKRYLYTLHIGQKLDVAIPFLFNEREDFEEFEEHFSEALLSSSVRIYLVPILPDEVPQDVLEQILKDTYALLREIESRVKDTKLEIRDALKFIRVAMNEDDGQRIIPFLRGAIDHAKDYYDTVENRRIIEIQVEDSSIIDNLINCLRR